MQVVFSYQKARTQAEALAKECGDEVCYPVASNLDRPTQPAPWSRDGETL